MCVFSFSFTLLFLKKKLLSLFSLHMHFSPLFPFSPSIIIFMWINSFETLNNLFTAWKRLLIKIVIKTPISFIYIFVTDHSLEWPFFNCLVILFMRIIMFEKVGRFYNTGKSRRQNDLQKEKKDVISVASKAAFFIRYFLLKI